MSTFTQPQLEVTGEPCLQCRLGDVLVDVWTDLYNGRRTIEGVAIAGTRVDIVSLLSDEQIKDIRRHAELTLPTREELARDFAEDAA